MELALILFKLLIIVITVISSNNWISVVTTNQHQSNNARGIYIYFNHDHSSKLIYASYSRDDDYYFNISTYSLGNNIPLFFDKIKVLGAQNCFTKTSWGDTAYYGTKLSKAIDNKNFLDIVTNTKISDKKINIFNKYASFKLLDIMKYYMAAFIISKQFIGFTWYYNNQDNKFYLQIIVYYYTRVWGSASNGGRWLNIGKGLDISFRQ